ncbi:g_PROTEIN_RECEP_F1_2 domain-containing protein [Caerostris darwini]|uniref:G_PROTEIN_RECEP_F1_2 domain-containing protein n=1 Tax=Caerostris darwini TaxID=1538125 RepID=A0AAV4VQ12_9ARAC|nr:g_PROTEIN_RECEP_F1_2 domain-containing protein [Caerostris darwini]
MTNVNIVTITAASTDPAIDTEKTQKQKHTHICTGVLNDYYVSKFMVMFSFQASVLMTCLTASVLTLSAISCDRFIAIIFPLHVRITKQRTSVVISAIWMVSVAVAIPFLIIRKYNSYQVSISIQNH